MILIMHKNVDGDIYHVTGRHPLCFGGNFYCQNMYSEIPKKQKNQKKHPFKIAGPLLTNYGHIKQLQM